MDIVNSMIEEMKKVEVDNDDHGDYSVDLLVCEDYIDDMYMFLEQKNRNGELTICSSDSYEEFFCKWPGTKEDFLKILKFLKNLSNIEIVPRLVISLYNIMKAKNRYGLK